MTKAYLLGLLHDATVRKTTYRIASKSASFCRLIAIEIKNLGGNAWIYKEASKRKLWKVHNSSKRIDPWYWRFYIRAQSYIDFANLIGSFHPEKRRYLRMKI